MRFFRAKLENAGADKHYLNFLFALNCVDYDVRVQIEQAVHGLLRQEAEQAAAMVRPSPARPAWRRILAAARGLLV